ncbi:MAG: TetR/AcrR family transcriptional regulator [Planctomycetota bacterium]
MAAKRLSHDLRKNAVVKAAMAVFAEKGFKGARTADLAEAAGVSEATIFKLFPDKKGLYEAILERKLKEMDALPLPFPEGEGPLTEAALEKAALGIIEHTEANPTFMRLLFFSGLENSPFARMFFQKHLPRRIRDRACDLARKTAGRAGIDPHIAAVAFHGMIIHYLILRQIFREPVARKIPKQAMARAIARIFLKGIEG